MREPRGPEAPCLEKQIAEDESRSRRGKDEAGGFGQGCSSGEFARHQALCRPDRVPESEQKGLKEVCPAEGHRTHEVWEHDTPEQSLLHERVHHVSEEEERREPDTALQSRLRVNGDEDQSRRLIRATEDQVLESKRGHKDDCCPDPTDKSDLVDSTPVQTY